uniref:Uncharacterized protein n=1 Tax=Cajanus cajan TaxID=3821 RepID=A0A151T1Q9_CAJCA|nr:hypothetical protein KK1_023409 [Cajanus cajan]
MVDLLGKNQLFEPMWDAVRSMKQEEKLSLSTFASVFQSYCTARRFNEAVMSFDVMDSGGLVPNLIMYNAMIGLLCNNAEIDHAFRLLDEMAFHGAFPDSLTYNMIFECLVKNKRVRETGRFFAEMVKNECLPTSSNCAAAIAMLFDCDDPEAAHEIWSYVVENQVKSLDDSANEFLVGLCNLSRISEAKRFADDVLDRRINIYESTMMILKDAFYKEGRSGRDRYDSLHRRWKAHLNL